MNIPKGKLFALVAVFAAIGLVTATGAFTTVTAERTADVSVAGDSNALLAISQTSNPNSAEYFSQSGGTSELTLAGQGSNGVNLRATTAIKKVFKITNQGSQEVAVTITAFDELQGESFDNTAEDGAVRFALRKGNVSVNSGSPTQTGIGFDDGQEVTISNSTGNPSTPNWGDRAVVLETGESMYVSLYIDTSDGDFGQEVGDSVYTSELASNSGDEDLLDQITIHASAEETNNAGWEWNGGGA